MQDQVVDQILLDVLQKPVTSPSAEQLRSLLSMPIEQAHRVIAQRLDAAPDAFKDEGYEINPMPERAKNDTIDWLVYKSDELTPDEQLSLLKLIPQEYNCDAVKKIIERGASDDIEKEAFQLLTNRAKAFVFGFHMFEKSYLPELFEAQPSEVKINILTFRREFVSDELSLVLVKMLTPDEAFNVVTNKYSCRGGWGRCLLRPDPMLQVAFGMLDQAKIAQAIELIFNGEEENYMRNYGTSVLVLSLMASNISKEDKIFALTRAMDSPFLTFDDKISVLERALPSLVTFPDGFFELMKSKAAGIREEERSSQSTQSSSSWLQTRVEEVSPRVKVLDSGYQSRINFGKFGIAAPLIEGIVKLCDRLGFGNKVLSLFGLQPKEILPGEPGPR